MKIVGIIPARYASTRLPGKPLADINGKTMIQHIYERVSESKLSRVIVATDNKEIKKVVEGFGGEVFLTSLNHTNGSSRVAEVAGKIEADFIINIQGDEPLISKDIIDKLISNINEDTKMITLKSKIKNEVDIDNANCVKVITDKNENAIYFSRSRIPFNREKVDTYYKHIGVYGYMKEFLFEYIKLEPTKLEIAESLEQLRVLENGYKIKVVEIEQELIGVDTIEELERVREILK